MAIITLRVKTNTGTKRVGVDEGCTLEDLHRQIMQAYSIIPADTRLVLALDIAGEKRLSGSDRQLHDVELKHGSEVFVLGKFETVHIEKAKVDESHNLVQPGTHLKLVEPPEDPSPAPPAKAAIVERPSSSAAERQESLLSSLPPAAPTTRPQSPKATPPAPLRSLGNEKEKAEDEATDIRPPDVSHRSTLMPRGPTLTVAEQHELDRYSEYLQQTGMNTWEIEQDLLLLRDELLAKRIEREEQMQSRLGTMTPCKAPFSSPLLRVRHHSPSLPLPPFFCLFGWLVLCSIVETVNARAQAFPLPSQGQSMAATAARLQDQWNPVLDASIPQRFSFRAFVPSPPSHEPSAAPLADDAGLAEEEQHKKPDALPASRQRAHLSLQSSHYMPFETFRSQSKTQAHGGPTQLRTALGRHYLGVERSSQSAATPSFGQYVPSFGQPATRPTATSQSSAPEPRERSARGSIPRLPTGARDRRAARSATCRNDAEQKKDPAANESRREQPSLLFGAYEPTRRQALQNHLHASRPLPPQLASEVHNSTEDSLLAMVIVASLQGGDHQPDDDELLAQALQASLFEEAQDL